MAERADGIGSVRPCHRVSRNAYWGVDASTFVWRGVPRLRIEKFSDSRTVTVDVDGVTHELSRAEATTLRETLADELEERREFVHTVGIHRADGSYEVRRRQAESAGHAKVFDSIGELWSLFEGLPETFAATDVEHTGLSGGRRHMLVRHLAEHPAFQCELVSRQPLRAEKGSPG